MVMDALLPRDRFEFVDPERKVGHGEIMVVGPEAGRLAVRIRPRVKPSADKS